MNIFSLHTSADSHVCIHTSLICRKTRDGIHSIYALGEHDACLCTTDGWMKMRITSTEIESTAGNCMNVSDVFVCMSICVMRSSWFKLSCTYSYAAGVWFDSEIEIKFGFQPVQLRFIAKIGMLCGQGLSHISVNHYNIMKVYFGFSFAYFAIVVCVLSWNHAFYFE